MTTTYMGMDLPIPGSTAGGLAGLYLWAEMLNTALEERADPHDHTSGKGTRVPTAGLLINADLDFHGYDATGLRSSRFEQQASVAASDDVACCYVLSSTGDLYYRNAAGVEIRLTSGGAVAAAGLTANQYAGSNKSASYTILPGDTATHFRFDCTAASRTATLPSAAAITDGRFFLLEITAGANRTLTIVPDGSDTVNGTSSVIVAGTYSAAYVVRVSSTAFVVLPVGPNVNGASVPSAGSLTTGNVLQVSSTAALTYAPLDLAGGADYVTGVLPSANLPQASDVEVGTVQLIDDLGGTGTAPTVVALSGSSNRTVVRSTSKTIEWASATVTPTLTQANETGPATTGRNMTVRAQTATDEEGGTLVLEGGDSVAGTARGGEPRWVGDAVSADEVVSGRAVVSVGGAATSSNVPSGDRVLWLADADTTPSGDPPVGGAVLYSHSGDFAFRNTSGHILRPRKIAASVAGASASGGVVSLPGVVGPSLVPAKVWVVTVDGTDYAIPMWTMASYT